jgi:branched-chain amino acid transport system substrate-binding protein
MAYRKSRMAEPVIGSLAQLGQNIRTARIRRELTVEMLAQQLGIHRTTLTRMEAGSPEVSIGHYANALFHLSLGTPFSEIAAPASDSTGLQFDLRRLPRRVRARSGHLPHYRKPALDRPSSANRTGFDAILKIGVVGAMSGPCALWGLVSRFSAETTAALHNDRGGLLLDGKRYLIEIVARDDRLCPDACYDAVKSLIDMGVRYIIGPNVEQTLQRVLPLAEKHGVMLFPYAMSRTLYSPPNSNTVLSQLAGYQAWPRIFRYLIEHRGVSSVAVLSPETPEAAQQQHEAMAAARQAGLEIIHAAGGYRAGADEPTAEISRLLLREPDLIVLPNLAPGDACRLIRGARAAGFRGHFATEAAQDAHTLYAALGDEVDGMVILGGALSRGDGSAYFAEFIERYTEIAGTWHDESGTKAYALEFILATLSRLGGAALSDIALFKSAIPDFAVRDPFRDNRQELRYTGRRYFSQKRQLRMPLTIKVADQGEFRPLISTEA